MKIKYAILLILISSIGSSCFVPDDDEDYPSIQIENNEIIQIENNQNTFSVGESITVETNIAIEQVAITMDGVFSNQTVNLTDYDYAEVGQSYYESELVLSKLIMFNGNSSTVAIPLTDAFITNMEGITETSELYNRNLKVKSIFNGTSYKNKFSIILPEAGTYFLSTNPYRLTGGERPIGYVSIRSKIINSNAAGQYEFTVN